MNFIQVQGITEDTKVFLCILGESGKLMALTLFKSSFKSLCYVIENIRLPGK